MPRYAVIDCGTNTFHLLIAAPQSDGGFREVYRERIFVKLAEEGIDRIGDQAYARALSVLEKYAQVITDHDVEDVRVSGTAAFRKASNGPQLVKEVREKTGLVIETIPGGREAQLIYRGVRRAIGLQEERWMVMDIGGGSVEFIISDQEGVRWYQSFPVGVAVKYRRFHRSEPITAEEIAETERFLFDQLGPLREALATYPTAHLVGAAGTFDVIANRLGTCHPTPHSAEIDLREFSDFYQQVIQATQAERHAMEHIPNDRADMIVVALILVRHIMNLAGIERLTVSYFSMKEGMLDEMMG